ncbi:MAG: copper-binding protein [Methyloversatilis sp.]|jgi:Cu(I)/Ag(I) efflux system protein CusF|uniref:copper-binding protein n=1 Tax=Methyloversatilis sp. TaxID=2569862 RepID=UPI0027376718|nr:copper-binding protein [Methyloversatilis sp.]MDP2868660.1 copper-binding protein [Methyloversatilis sp.]MDP3289355.1 copper-binding protein [Methyloversatilis sp.]MDP3578852.1 copper-binding protein [Methyloversatilis sp.]
MKLITTTLVALSMALSSVAYADDAHHPEKAAAAAPAVLSSGEIKKIDKEAGKVTIKHGPLVNLDMAPMTMVFRVKEAAMLDKVKVGDKVNFAADKINGALTVTQVELAN